MNVSAQIEAMEPLFLGDGPERLFGCYHAPQGTAIGGFGVVMCYPVEMEYVYAHRAFRQLARRLSRAGFPVLRFDYYGCGDSGGEFADANIAVWTEDVSVAVEELKARSNLNDVCMVGLGLGGYLALRYAMEIGGVRRVVLWDPVMDGRKYVDELRAAHVALERTHGDPDRDVGSQNGAHTELMGFEFSEILLRELSEIEPSNPLSRPADSVLVIDSGTEPDRREFAGRVQSTGAKVVYQHTPTPKLLSEDPNATFVPNQILQSIVRWVSEDQS